MHHGSKSALSSEQLLAQLQGNLGSGTKPEGLSPRVSPSTLGRAHRERQKQISSAGAIRRADELLNVNKDDRDEVDKMLVYTVQGPSGNSPPHPGHRGGSRQTSARRQQQSPSSVPDTNPAGAGTSSVFPQHLNREPTLYDLRRILRRFDPQLVARESLLQLMEQEETVSCPLTIVQQQYSQLMQEAIGTDVAILEQQQRETEDDAILRGVGIKLKPTTAKKEREGAGPGERFSATATAQLERLDLHETYVDLAHEGLQKDQKILRLQRRITELEDHAAHVHRSLTIGAGVGEGHVGGANSTRRKSNSSAAVNLASYHARSDDRDRTTIRELMELNKALSEHIDILEFNMNQGFSYSDVGIQKTLSSLTSERDELKLRNMQLAECFILSEQEKQKLVKSNDKLQITNQDQHRSAETLEKELVSIRTELGRVKRLYQERALSAI